MLLYFRLSISYDIISSKINDKPNDFDFDIFNCPLLDGNVLCAQMTAAIDAFSALSKSNDILIFKQIFFNFQQTARL